MTNPLQGSDEETQQKQTTRDLLMTVRRALPFSSARPKTHAAYEAIDELLDRAQKEAEARDSLESALREAQKDVERLDWLSDERPKMQSTYDGQNFGVRIGVDSGMAYFKSSVREAIDAARADTGEST